MVELKIQVPEIIICILTFVLIILKLTGCIDWDWIWIFSPIWITMFLGIVMILVMIFVIYCIIEK